MEKDNKKYRGIKIICVVGLISAIVAYRVYINEEPPRAEMFASLTGSNTGSLFKTLHY